MPSTVASWAMAVSAMAPFWFVVSIVTARRVAYRTEVAPASFESVAAARGGASPSGR
jgi:hypothetical protein